MIEYVSAFLVGAMLLSGCGTSGSGGVAAKANFVNGATPVARMSLPHPARKHARPSQVWQVTPDTLKLTLTKIQFLDATNSGPSATLSNCTATFDKSKAGLAALSNCDFSVAAGTYYGMIIYVNSTVEATINDASGFY